MPKSQLGGILYIFPPGFTFTYSSNQEVLSVHSSTCGGNREFNDTHLIF